MISMTPAGTTSLSNLKMKVESRQTQIGIVGMGYVGLPLALLFSSERFAADYSSDAADQAVNYGSGVL